MYYLIPIKIHRFLRSYSWQNAIIDRCNLYNLYLTGDACFRNSSYNFLLVKDLDSGGNNLMNSLEEQLVIFTKVEDFFFVESVGS